MLQKSSALFILGKGMEEDSFCGTMEAHLKAGTATSPTSEGRSPGQAQDKSWKSLRTPAMGYL